MGDRAMKRVREKTEGTEGFFRRPAVKNVLSALAVAVFGFILLNLAFLLDFLFQSVITRILGLFLPAEAPLMDMNLYWFPPLKHGMFVVLICLISWFVFKSKLGALLKAIFMTVPLATIFATMGIFLYRWPPLAYLTGALFGAGVLWYLRRKKAPWLYYYTLALVAAALALMGILGVDI